VYSGTDWVPLASEVTNLSGYYTKGETDIITAPTGLKKVVPSSVAVGSGTGSADSLGNVTFSGASSVSINGCFSTTYTNYKLVVNISSRSTTAQINFRFRKSGTDNSASTYYSGFITTEAASSSIVYLRNALASSGAISESRNGDTFMSFDVYQPFSNVTSYLLGQSNNPNDVRHFSGGVSHLTIDSFDGFTVYPSAGNIAGTLSIYGYTN
jgi:hypothetical protein